MRRRPSITREGDRLTLTRQSWPCLHLPTISVFAFVRFIAGQKLHLSETAFLVAANRPKVTDVRIQDDSTGMLAVEVHVFYLNDKVDSMILSRRSALGLITASAPALRLANAWQDGGPMIPAGAFKGTRESLQAYQCPEGFCDAKFGIWAHWGPQSATEAGDWYARSMYMEGSRQYKIHCEKYGHPTKFGYKDIIPTWKAEKFNAENLMDRSTSVGTRCRWDRRRTSSACSGPRL
jgi:Alpha-L-fucosidase